MSTRCGIALRWMPRNATDEKSTLVQVMGSCRQATSRSQCFPRSMSHHMASLGHNELTHHPPPPPPPPPEQNDRHFADDTFKRIFLNEHVRISSKFSLKFVSKGPVNYITALVQIKAWCRPGDKPLSETMVVKLLTHICAPLGLNIKNVSQKTETVCKCVLGVGKRQIICMSILW